MHDMLPRKPTAAVADLKKGLIKDSLFGNGMNASSASPAHSGGSPAPDEGINMKMRPDSPLMKNCEKAVNSSSNCLSSMMPKPLTPSVVPSTTTPPLSSPLLGPMNRSSKTSPKHKQRRNQSTDSKLKNQFFSVENSSAVENNYCANNNNNSKQNNESKFSLQQRRPGPKSDEQSRTSRTPSRNSVSDDLSSSSLTPTTDEQANSTSGQKLDLSMLDVNSEALSKLFNDIDNVPDTRQIFFPEEIELDDIGTRSPLKSSVDLPALDEALLDNLKDSSSSSKQLHTSTVSPSNMPTSMMSPSSSSSPLPFSIDSKSAPSSDQPRKVGKSHLQDILGVTDTIRLESMSRPIDSVPYKSPTTTTSYSTGVKPTINQPCTNAPPSRQHHGNLSSPSFNKPRPHFQFANNGQMFRPHSHGYMDNGLNHGGWGRGSPKNMHPGMMKSPPFSAPYVETSISPTGNVNPMCGLQSTVDSIPAAPMGSSEPGTPTQVMGPPLRSPLSTDATPSPGSGKMRPPPSPSVAGDKRCTSADSVAAGNNGKKAGNKRERTRSADSKDEERKDAAAPKTKRRKSKSKDDNNAGKKSTEGKTPGRSGLVKDDKMPRQGSALTSLLNVEASNPYVYVFSTDQANKAATMVSQNKVPSITLYHQSYIGTRTLTPSEPFNSQTSMPSVEKSEPTHLTSTDTPTMSMPTTSRSPTEMSAEKTEPNNNLPMRSPSIDAIPRSQPVQAINLQDTKPPMLLLPTTNIPPVSSFQRPVKSESTGPNFPVPSVTSQNGDQNEMLAEKMRNRQSKLGKLKLMRDSFIQNEHSPIPGAQPNQGPRPSWVGQPGPMRYHVPMDKLQPGMKEMPGPEGMIPHGQPIPPDAEWMQLVQEHHADKMRRQEVGMPCELPSRPPPPYAPSPQQFMVRDGYMGDPRMPMEHMSHPRLQRVGSGHRQIMRMPQDPRVSAGYMPRRMGIPHGHYPPPHPGQPQGQQQRMPMYEPYMGPPGIRHSSRLPHPGMRPPGENYPFSEQLMKQASYYNSGNVPPYDPETGVGSEWAGPEGTQRLTHMSGASTSPAVGPQGPVMAPMDISSRMNPGMPNRQGYDSMGHYPSDMQPQRYDMLPPMRSPTGHMDGRIRGPSGVGSMMDAIARRGAQRPPDLNLNSQIPPRSPMNYPGGGPMPSPGMAAMNSVGPRFSNPGEMGHPQPSPMHSRSPSIGMGQHLPMGPSSAGVEQPQVMMGPAGPHSAGPMSNPQPNDWSVPAPIPGTPTANPGMMHHSMTSQHASMTSQQGMMSSQAAMMTPQPPQQQPPPPQPQMMTSPTMMPQAGMMPSSQPQGIPRGPTTPSSGKPGPNPISIMMDRMNMFKMPDKSPLYQDAVKDTTSPPPLTHQGDPPPLSHNPMTSGMRMAAPGHPPTYDSRIPHPRMGHPHEGYPQPQPQGYPAGHPSPMSNASMSSGGAPMMMNMPHDSLPPPNEYPQQPARRQGYPDVQDFDLRNILPSEMPSQTISYLPPESNNSNQFSSPSWAGPEGIRPQLMQGPSHPAGPRSMI